ncbi:hypothetical protein G7Z17_g2150 [Cylindrodendrum hubeiense]|uniref:Uncharacterized protein n=1 Tax=Cylindrodendrum hubeiense TaxID=595255 RepID=A0A9P5HNR2_9HYPO|nr:hypothetical protein G7Z17_g2150 [Cylindrodendrum hubeiense]
MNSTSGKQPYRTMIEHREEFKILDALLQRSDVSVANAVQQILKLTTAAWDDSGSLGSHPWYTFDSLIEISKTTVPAQQTKLVEFVFQLHKVQVIDPKTGDPVKDDNDYLVWTELPALGYTAADEWNAFDVFDPSATPEEKQRWENMIAFLAQLSAAADVDYNSTIISEMNFTFWSLRAFKEAFEPADEKPALEDLARDVEKLGTGSASCSALHIIPSRCGYDLKNLKDESAERIASLAQSWLYFGVIATVFHLFESPPVDLERFKIERVSSDGSLELVVNSEELKTLLDKWFRAAVDPAFGKPPVEGFREGREPFRLGELLAIKSRCLKRLGTAMRHAQQFETLPQSTAHPMPIVLLSIKTLIVSVAAMLQASIVDESKTRIFERDYQLIEMYDAHPLENLGSSADDIALKFKAINQMAAIYSCAIQILILDSTMQKINSADVDVCELLARISSMAWMTRCWTFQEGALAGDCQIQTADKSIDPLRMVLEKVTENTYRMMQSKGKVQAVRNTLHAFHTFYLMIREKKFGPVDGEPSAMLQGRLTTRPVTAEEALQVMLARPMKYDLRLDLHLRKKEWFSRNTKLDIYLDFLRCWNVLERRTTTKPNDIHIIIANILNFNAFTIINMEKPEDRMAIILWSLPRIPLAIFFDNTSTRHNSDEHHSNRWLPLYPSRKRIKSPIGVVPHGNLLKLDTERNEEDGDEESVHEDTPTFALTTDANDSDSAHELDPVSSEKRLFEVVFDCPITVRLREHDDDAVAITLPMVEGESVPPHFYVAIRADF